MRRKLVAFLFLAFTPTLLFAQTKLKLEFPEEGDREVWFGADWPKQKPDTTETLSGTSGNIVKPARADQKLFVWDKTTGNIASKPVKDIVDVWRVASSDFQRIGQVTLRIEHAGQPLTAAQVVVKTKGFSRDELLDTSSNGQVELFAVPPGELEVAVKYKAKEAGSKTLSQKFPLKLERDTPSPVLAVSIVDEVETIAPKKKEPAAALRQDQPTEEGGGSFVSLLLTYVLAIGLAGGAGYLIFNYVRNNKDTVQKKLEALGVQMPEPTDGTAASAPPAPFVPEPPQKIILDDAAPVPPVGVVDPYSPAPAASIPAVAPLAGSPRLIGEDGRVFELEEGLLAVGREDGLPISLVGESTVSRQHAEVTRSGNDVTVTDLGSTNGTYVNGQKVQGDVQLRHGDTVQFGAVRFRYEG